MRKQDGLTQVSPQVAAVLGAAFGFFLVGTVLAAVVLVGDYEYQEPRFARPSPTAPARDGSLQKMLAKLERDDAGLVDLEDRLTQVGNALSSLRSGVLPSGAVPAMAGTATGSVKSVVASTHRALARAEGEASRSGADTAVLASLQALESEPSGDRAWDEALQFALRAIRLKEGVANLNRDLRGQVEWAVRAADLTPAQCDQFQRIRERENGEVADLMAQLTPENQKEIRAEATRVRTVALEEFKTHLRPEQASRFGTTLTDVQRPAK